MMRAGSSSLREKIINYVIEKESNAIHECKSEKNIIDIYIAHFIILCCGSINFILGLHFIFVCFKPIIIHYDTQKQ